MSQSSLRGGGGGRSRSGGRFPCWRDGRASGSDHNARSPLSFESIQSRVVEGVGIGQEERSLESAQREEIHAETQNLRFITIRDIDGDKAVLETIAGILRGNFHGAWRTYTHVPQEVRERWWTIFKLRYWWEEDIEKVRSSFNTRACNWLNHTLAARRKSGQRPEFISEGHWKELMEHWSSDEFTAKREKAKKNSEKGKEKQYHGGRLSVAEHEKRMEKEKNKKPRRSEVFQRCYTKKNCPPPPVVAKAMSDFQSLLSQKSQSSEDGSNSVNEDAVFVKAVGVVKKRCFGMGSSARSVTIGSSAVSGGMTEIPPRWRGEIEKQVAVRFEKEKEQIVKAYEEQKTELVDQVKKVTDQFSQFMESVRGTSSPARPHRSAQN